MSNVETALTIWQPPGIVCYASDMYATAAIYQWWFELCGLTSGSYTEQLRSSNLAFVIPDTNELKKRMQSSTRMTLANNLFDAANKVEALVRQSKANPQFILVMLECRESNFPPYQKIHYGGLLVIRHQAGPLLMYFGTVIEYFTGVNCVGLQDPLKLSPDNIQRMMTEDHILVDLVKRSLTGYVKPLIL